MQNYFQIVSEFQKLQLQMSNLWIAIERASPEFNNSINVERKDAGIIGNGDLSFPMKGTWYDRIHFILQMAKRPLTAREIMDLMAPLLGEDVDVIRDRVNTNCSTMRQEGRLEFLPNYVGSQRGKYNIPQLLNSTSNQLNKGKLKATITPNLGFEDFKKWLKTHGVKAGVEAYVSRLRMFENGANESISIILKKNGLEYALNKIDDNVFKSLVPGTRSAMRSAIRKYANFQSMND